ncbi:histone-lysine N-methyltransferase SMYD3 isoform X2 [Ixodes scapularis]|uniref:histone-lysine N-methyltransferase SMYD3 isoform X2 n=1 Tax=Ixodes scapularis TaxID=6945 RepID=UPI001A9CF362|nr:histone-lysine N-methyltransferase SMYD3 isoform X2 [Ixodes scapularis]
MMRAYRRGDVILTSEPFAYVVDPQNGAGKVCDYCLKRSSRLKGCPKCRVAHYCNKFCESSALSDHQTECCYFQEMFPCIPNTTVRLMARILIKLRVLINRFCITDDELKPVGQGLYIGASIFDHSCDPDAAFVFDGTRLTVRAVRDLSVSSVREIYICYVDKLQMTPDRIETLQNQYYFTCNCTLCHQKDGDLLQEKSNSLSVSIRNLQMELESTDDKQTVEWISERTREILSSQVKELPPNDISRIEALELAFECCAKRGLHAKAAGYAMQILDVLRCCYGIYSTKYGLFLFNIGKQYDAAGDHRSAETFFHMASWSLSVTHGKTHPVFRELQERRRANRRCISGPCK